MSMVLDFIRAMAWPQSVSPEEYQSALDEWATASKRANDWAEAARRNNESAELAWARVAELEDEKAEFNAAAFVLAKVDEVVQQYSRRVSQLDQQLVEQSAHIARLELALEEAHNPPRDMHGRFTTREERPETD